ncbi:Glutathione S-transferase [Bosea sp. 62]|uniref:glutathione S-transferase family protein n=1 Tax=unclassified Bosea (in: a-proteobacteria) TaxID=2653178 RepID=UPI0012555324|nr:MULTISPECIES: glutathione S-transferase family protein [unclassified Bosea (in: a-proteobacteria)]CAD5266842.1 Glutathione S-transferase [Bosea sp. 46]CAD5268347.1 Glutathione S-transferase [Bosea sp. 21B]CAD5270272.1 Glutathione S-transferase [Bosea sp. 7B]VVT62401.1 Glutathione S-transferase [Bosea sp. EC-HK365B]VXB91391.1 Glutathione S-transferase [Bosea sp. 29B]
MITLYSGPLSLFSRKVEIALREKGLAFERIMVPFNQTTGYDPKHPEVVALNPKQQVPVLNDDGIVLYDSTVILEYLEDAYPEPPLLPLCPGARARCRLDELYADEIMLQALKPLMHRTTPPSTDQTRRFAQETDALIAENALEKHYGVLEDRLAGREFFGDAVSVADIALFMSVLFSLRLGGPSLAPFDGLSRWFERLKLRPAFTQATVEIAEADRRLSFPLKRA